jgi:hypothetical protein
MQFKRTACAIDVNFGLAAVAAMLCAAASQTGSGDLRRINRVFAARGHAAGAQNRLRGRADFASGFKRFSPAAPSFEDFSSIFQKFC